MQVWFHTVPTTTGVAFVKSVGCWPLFSFKLSFRLCMLLMGQVAGTFFFIWTWYSGAAQTAVPAVDFCWCLVLYNSVQHIGFC